MRHCRPPQRRAKVTVSWGIFGSPLLAELLLGMLGRPTTSEELPSKPLKRAEARRKGEGKGPPMQPSGDLASLAPQCSSMRAWGLAVVGALGVLGVLGGFGAVGFRIEGLGA